MRIKLRHVLHAGINLARMTSTPQPYVITGITSGAPQLRQEINTFVQNDKMFSLYVQALKMMQNDSQKDVTSFFQVAGIHGLPYVAWDGAIDPNGPVDPNDQWAGYCTHGSTLFPTWHRPYVMLYEQILQNYAAQVANTYTVDTAAWQQAAADFRQPYWDWATNSVPPAQVISMDQVTITGPNGKKISVSNPLKRYAFDPIDPSFPPPYDKWNTTLRQPDTTSPGATDDVTRLKRVLQNAQRSITTTTYSMLTRADRWSAMADHTPDNGGSATNSLEAIHDNIHVLVGGLGHMSDPSVAAFDPIFWLHHANVDRMLSLWAAIHPGLWVSDGSSEDGTFTIAANTTVGQTTALTPFWSDQHSFWISDSVTGTSQLGYNYPEFDGVDTSNSTTLRTHILNVVNRLYGGGSSKTSSRELVDLGSESSFADVTSASGDVAPRSLDIERLPARADPGDQPALEARSQSGGSTYSDWTARVRYRKYELKRSFIILFFLGDPPHDPKTWLVANNLAGTQCAFVNSAASQCQNCRNQGQMMAEGFVPLNMAIAKHSGLGTYDSEVVEPYLKKRLTWRAQLTDGTPVTLESLEVVVLEVPLILLPGALIPVVGEITHHPGITVGRMGLSISI